MLPDGHSQNGLQRAIQLHSHDLACAQTELLRQGADAGTDLQHAAGGIHPGKPGHILHHPAGFEEVLTLGMGEAEAVPGEKLPNLRDCA